MRNYETTIEAIGEIAAFNLFDEENRSEEIDAPTYADLTEFDDAFWLCSLIAEGRATETLELYENTNVVTVYRLFAARELHRYYAEKRWENSPRNAVQAEFPKYEQLRLQNE